MTRKALGWMALILIAVLLALPLTGCNRSAVGDDVAKLEQQMAQEAAQNTPQPQPVAETPAAPPEAPAETAQPETPPASPPATEAPPAAGTPVETPSQPVVTTPAAEPVVTAPGTHVVQAGENLFRIALRYGVTVDALAKANNITNAATIYVGQVLVIPTGGTAPTPSQPVTPPSGAATVHVVQPGENLFRIALRYGLDYYELARYNGISNPAMIYVGQQIKIPPR